MVPLALPTSNALNLVTTTAAITTRLVGASELRFTYTGTGRNRHLYAQVADDTTGLVPGNIAPPIPVTLEGHSRTATIALEPVALTLANGRTVTLQLVASAGSTRSSTRRGW